MIFLLPRYTNSLATDPLEAAALNNIAEKARTVYQGYSQDTGEFETNWSKCEFQRSKTILHHRQS